LVVLRLLTAAFPFRAEGRLLQGPFSELARRSRKLWPADSLNRLKRPFCTEGFRDFVTSTSASIASGWNDQLPDGIRTHRTTTPSRRTPWKDNDPEYAEPMPVEVRDITGIKKLNDKLIASTSFVDESIDLAKVGEESSGYKYAVYAYIVKAVNRRGGESGPSPYALTIPSEPVNLLNNDKGGVANLKWDANPEKGIAGYRVYKLTGTWNITRLTEEPFKETTFTHKNAGTTRYWITAIDALGQEGQPSSPAWHEHTLGRFFSGEWHQ
jgi:hypothetical protein